MDLLLRFIEYLAHLVVAGAAVVVVVVVGTSGRIPATLSSTGIVFSLIIESCRNYFEMS